MARPRRIHKKCQPSKDNSDKNQPNNNSRSDSNQLNKDSQSDNASRRKAFALRPEAPPHEPLAIKIHRGLSKKAASRSALFTTRMKDPTSAEKRFQEYQNALNEFSEEGFDVAPFPDLLAEIDPDRLKPFMTFQQAIFHIRSRSIIHLEYMVLEPLGITVVVYDPRGAIFLTSNTIKLDSEMSLGKLIVNLQALIDLWRELYVMREKLLVKCFDVRIEAPELTERMPGFTGRLQGMSDDCMSAESVEWDDEDSEAAAFWIFLRNMLMCRVAGQTTSLIVRVRTAKRITDTAQSLTQLDHGHHFVSGSLVANGTYPLSIFDRRFSPKPNTPLLLPQSTPEQSFLTGSFQPSTHFDNGANMDYGPLTNEVNRPLSSASANIQFESSNRGMTNVEPEQVSGGRSCMAVTQQIKPGEEHLASPIPSHQGVLGQGRDWRTKAAEDLEAALGFSSDDDDIFFPAGKVESDRAVRSCIMLSKLAPAPSDPMPQKISQPSFSAAGQANSSPRLWTRCGALGSGMHVRELDVGTNGHPSQN